MAKIRQPAKRVVLLPNQSERSPAIKAPKKVPAERIETIRDWLEEEMTYSAAGVVAWLRPVMVLMKKGMARTLKTKRKKNETKTTTSAIVIGGIE